MSDCSEDADYAYDENGDTIRIPQPRISYWPAPLKRAQPDWVASLSDDTLREVLQEVYGALNADYRILAAIGARTALDRTLVLLKAPEADGFAQKLNFLVQQHVIGPVEKDTLLVLTDAGSASAHRGWRPTPQDLTTMMQVIENFLHRQFVLHTAANAMKVNVPQRPQRIKMPKPTP